MTIPGSSFTAFFKAKTFEVEKVIATTTSIFLDRYIIFNPLRAQGTFMNHDLNRWNGYDNDLIPGVS